jgi:hypothetical protein
LLEQTFHVAYAALVRFGAVVFVLQVLSAAGCPRSLIAGPVASIRPIAAGMALNAAERWLVITPIRPLVLAAFLPAPAFALGAFVFALRRNGSKAGRLDRGCDALAARFGFGRVVLFIHFRRILTPQSAIRLQMLIRL